MSIFDRFPLELSGPARDMIDVTPSDSVDIASEAIALYIETGGTISLVTSKGTTKALTVPDFFILPLGATRVNATGTTATGISAFVVL